MDNLIKAWKATIMQINNTISIHSIGFIVTFSYITVILIDTIAALVFVEASFTDDVVSSL